MLIRTLPHDLLFSCAQISYLIAFFYHSALCHYLRNTAGECTIDFFDIAKLVFDVAERLAGTIFGTDSRSDGLLFRIDFPIESSGAGCHDRITSGTLGFFDVFVAISLLSHAIGFGFVQIGIETLLGYAALVVAILTVVHGELE